MTEDEIIGWHHQLYGHEFEQVPGADDGQEAWRAAVHGIAKSRTRLSDCTKLKQVIWQIDSKISPSDPHLLIFTPLYE